MDFCPFFNTKDEGWHFYHDLQQTTPEEHRPKTLKDLKEQAQILLETAVLDPSPQNILRYQRIQKYIMEKSEQFAKIWVENLLKEPDIDNTVTSPHSYYGLLALKEHQEQQKQLTFKKIRQTADFILILDTTYLSKKLAIVVKNMTKQYQFSLHIIDANFDPEEQKTQWQIKRIPALLMRQNGVTSIITYGLLAQDALEEQVMKRSNT